MTDILADVQYTIPDHHFGRPFVTAYQLAVQFSRRHPEDVAAIGQPIGGAGIGQHSSLAQYLAGRVSTEIRDGRANHTEDRFISNQHLEKISFRDGTQVFDSSLTETQFDLSLFRLRD